MKILLIIPAYNEQENIEKVCNNIKEYNEKNEQKLDYIVINDTIAKAAEAICAIVKAESMKSSRNINIKEKFI